jgi:tetratricopeptide (TPR) repeat protein
MHLYLYQYPTNETLMAALAGVVVYFVLRIVCVPGAGIGNYLALGFALGLGLLTKISAAVLIPPLGLVMAAKLLIDRRQRSQKFLRLVLTGLVALSVCGWYYASVWAHFGRPVVTNVDPDIGAPWWQDPGYRVAADFWRVGATFRAPFFSTYHGFCDALYSTCWADSQCSGTPSLDDRPPWSYDFMAAGFLLSLLPAAAIVLGTAVALGRFLHRPTLAWGFLLSLALLVLFFLAYLELAWSTYAVKAFYGSMGIVSLCVVAALGLDLLAARWRWLSGVVFIVLGVWAGNNALSYWISPSAWEVRLPAVMKQLDRGDISGAIAHLEQLRADYPQHSYVRLLLCQLYTQTNQRDRARQALDLDAGGDVARRHMALGRLLAQQPEHYDDALRELQTAMAMNPEDSDAAWAYAFVQRKQGHPEAAIEGLRNVLRINPYRVDCHATLAQLYSQIGKNDLAQQHEQFAARLAHSLGP